MPADMDEIADLERYPLDRRDLRVLEELIDESRREFAASGVLVLREFLREEALAEIAANCLANGAIDGVRLPDIDLAEQRGRAGEPPPVIECLLAGDRIPASSPLKRLYLWEPLLDFVSRVVGEPAYRSADSLGALTVHIQEHGEGQDWHFDLPDYMLDVHIAAPEQGGVLEYHSLPRAVLQRSGAQRQRIGLLPTAPGTFLLHAGRLSRHRVTPVRGRSPRITAAMAFHGKPGQRLTDHVRRKRFGRTE
ncbi:hypothetical protein ACIP5Y_10740 [Nocardia sp. NPDC088792]|uniref:HalD/BesD family halogenase n=1 Tax=Nocardia sp. NPDC088792 TaxID=3364332 RepID=UPI00380BF7D8